MPADGQASSAYLVSTGSTRLLLDCGPGALTALSAVTTPAALDGIIISHLHSDHCYDLLPLGKSLLTGRLADPARYPTLPHAGVVPGPPIPLWVPAGGRAAKAAGVGELVLTHFVTADPTWLEMRRAEACQEFPGPVHLAAPGREFTVS